MGKAWRGIAAVLVLGLALAGCGQRGAPAAPQGQGGQKVPIRIGMVFSITGNASSLGEPERNTVELYRQEEAFATIGGHPVEWIVQDDGSDVNHAVTQVKRLIEERQVAAVVCCTTSPNSMAILETVQAARVPNISVAAAASIVTPASERRWVFKTPQNDALMIDILTDDMLKRGIRRVAFIGFDDAYGQSGLAEFQRIASQKGIELVAQETFKRTDTDATPQVLRMAAANPDAFLIWAIPPGANVAHKNIRDQGLTQPIYQSHGVANRRFIELGGQAVEGTLLPAGKLLVAWQLPDDDPQKLVLLAYQQKYEFRYGQGTANTFGGHAYDAMLVLKGAIERALAGGADPADVAAFRQALRDEIENTRELVGISGIFTYSPDDHHGLDRRAAVMVTIRNGDWRLAE